MGGISESRETEAATVRGIFQGGFVVEVMVPMGKSIWKTGVFDLTAFGVSAVHIWIRRRRYDTGEFRSQRQLVTAGKYWI
jgi:hypothetical protein